MSSQRVGAIIGVGVLAATFAAAPAMGAPGSQVAGACAAGMHQVNIHGQPGFRFCGSASAVVHLGARTLRFSNGLCRQAAGTFTVNIGTVVPSLRSAHALEPAQRFIRGVRAVDGEGLLDRLAGPARLRRPRLLGIGGKP